MRSWDRSKPEERLGPRPEPLPKAQVSRTVRGVTSAKVGRCNATCTTDVISLNLQQIRLSEDRQNRCAVSVRLVGVFGRLILRGDSKTWVIGFESKSQTVFWLGLSHMAQRFCLTERLLLLWPCSLVQSLDDNKKGPQVMRVPLR